MAREKKSLLTRNLIYCPGDSGLHNIIPKSISSLRGYYGLLRAGEAAKELLPPPLVFHSATTSFTSDLGCQVGKSGVVVLEIGLGGGIGLGDP